MEDIISKAKNYAMIKHMGQARDDGSPYVFHPLRVSQYLSLAAPKDDNLIAAGALHDVIEDCNVTYEELKKEFNKDIADLVMEVTKEKPSDKVASYFPRLKTRRGVLLKFFDRADNLSDLRSWTEEKTQWYLNTSKFWRDSALDPIYSRFKKRPVNKPIKGQITVDDMINGTNENKKEYDFDTMSKHEIAFAIQSDDELRITIAENMETYGGSFVKNLAKCLFGADRQNRYIIAQAFPEYIDAYRPDKWSK